VKQRRSATELFRSIIFQNRPDDSAFGKGRFGRSNTGQGRGGSTYSQYAKRFATRPFSAMRIGMLVAMRALSPEQPDLRKRVTGDLIPSSERAGTYDNATRNFYMG
jgi:hypothetical protein